MKPYKSALAKRSYAQHRLTQAARDLACVNTCIVGARYFGDLNDPDSEVSERITSDSVFA